MSLNSEDRSKSPTPRPESTPRGGPKWLHSRLGITFVVLYTLVVLGGALVASTWLYDWSRLRILGTSSLAELANLDFLTSSAWNKPADQTPETAGEAAAQGSAEDESAQSQSKEYIP